LVVRLRVPRLLERLLVERLRAVDRVDVLARFRAALRVAMRTSPERCPRRWGDAPDWLMLRHRKRYAEYTNMHDL